ncbi:hypothetical protein EDM76_10165, partial [bacterium]
MTKILVLSRAFVGRKMASPGIRAYHLAGALGRALPEAEVTLAIPGDKGEVALPAPNVRLQVWDGNSSATALARSHDIAIARNFPPHFARLLGTTRFALDAFTPLYIEWMELSKRDIVPRWRRTWMSGNRWYLNFQLTLADFIFCADERQRDHRPDHGEDGRDWDRERAPDPGPVQASCSGIGHHDEARWGAATFAGFGLGIR